MVKAAQKEDQNVISDPEMRKKFKSRVAELTHYYQKQDDIRDGLKDGIASVASEYNIDKKLVRRMASTMYKANYRSLLEENRHFETLYEMIIEGKLRDPDDFSDKDPLDEDDADE